MTAISEKSDATTTRNLISKLCKARTDQHATGKARLCDIKQSDTAAE